MKNEYLSLHRQNIYNRKRTAFDWEEDSLKHMMLEEDIEKLNNILSELVDENPQFCQFVNNVTVCCYDVMNDKPKFIRPILTDFMEISTHNDITDAKYLLNYLKGQIFDTVTFTEFSLEELPTIINQVKNSGFLDCQDGQLMLQRSPSFYSEYHSEPRFLKELCYNCNPEFKDIPKKSHITFEHIKKLFAIQAQNGSFLTVNEFIFIGPASILAAIVFFDGTFIVRWSVFKSYLEEFGKDTTKILLKNLFDRFVFHMFSGQSTDLSNMKQYFENRILKDMSTRFSNFTIDEHCGFIVDGKFNVPAFSRFLETMIKEKINGAINQSSVNAMFFGGHKYEKLLTNILAKFSDQIKQYKNECFIQGLKFNTIFESLGWTFVTDCKEIPGFYSTDASSFWWKKDINLHPDRYCYYRNLYELSEEKKTWYTIETIYVCADGGARAKQKKNSKLSYWHPNVGSGGNVCMGDLRLSQSLIYLDIEHIKNYLDNVCELLKIINFDSPYSSSDFQLLSEDSKLIESVAIKRHSQDKKNDIATVQVPTFKRATSLSQQQMKKTTTIKKDTSVQQGNVQDFICGVTHNDIIEVRRILTDIERTQSPVFNNNKIIDWSRSSTWLHPNGTSYFHIPGTVYGRCYYQKNRYSSMYELTITNFNKCITICRLIKIGNLFNIYKNYLTDINVVRFINDFTKYHQTAEVSMTDIVCKITCNTIAKKDQDSEQVFVMSEINRKVPNPLLLNFSEFFDKIDKKSTIAVK